MLSHPELCTPLSPGPSENKLNSNCEAVYLDFNGPSKACAAVMTEVTNT